MNRWNLEMSQYDMLSLQGLWDGLSVVGSSRGKIEDVQARGTCIHPTHPRDDVG